MANNSFRVISLWSTKVSNLDQSIHSNIWGLGDLIRGTFQLYQICRKHNLLFDLDFRNHPISQIMIQKSEKGGLFEYCPYIREPGNENFEEVKKVLDGDRKRVRQLELEQGDLQIFKGRFTLHRVTKIEGNRSRYLCIPAYVLDPWRVNTPEHSRTIYGKVLPIHIERNKERADGLAD